MRLLSRRKPQTSGCTGVHFYVDGVAEPHSTDDVGPLLVRNTPVVIGQAGPGKSNEYFEGLIDEVKIYTKALSQQEIARECGCQITQPPLPPVRNFD